MAILTQLGHPRIICLKGINLGRGKIAVSLNVRGNWICIERPVFFVCLQSIQMSVSYFVSQFLLTVTSVVYVDHKHLSRSLFLDGVIISSALTVDIVSQK